MKNITLTGEVVFWASPSAFLTTFGDHVWLFLNPRKKRLCRRGRDILTGFFNKKTMVFQTKFEAKLPGTRVFEKSHPCRQNVEDAEPFASQSYRISKIRDAFFTPRCFRLFLTFVFLAVFCCPKWCPHQSSSPSRISPTTRKKLGLRRQLLKFRRTEGKEKRPYPRGKQKMN